MASDVSLDRGAAAADDDGGDDDLEGGKCAWRYCVEVMLVTETDDEPTSEEPPPEAAVGRGCGRVDRIFLFYLLCPVILAHDTTICHIVETMMDR